MKLEQAEFDKKVVPYPVGRPQIHSETGKSLWRKNSKEHRKSMSDRGYKQVQIMMTDQSKKILDTNRGNSTRWEYIEHLLEKDLREKSKM